jgi:hypothetical protein
MSPGESILSAATWAFDSTSGGALWDWWSGATAVGPRWLAISLGGMELLIVAVGIVVALWPADRLR